MKKPLTIGELNLKKYLIPPQWSDIQDFINEVGVSFYQFERFYDIPRNTITQVKSGSRELPATYWHIIYLRIKPAYGSGFLYEYSPKQENNRIKVPLTRSLTKLSDNHTRLSTVK